MESSAILSALYETVFRLSVALVATLVAIYALWLSLLGPAIGAARASAARSRKALADTANALAVTTGVLLEKVARLQSEACPGTPSTPSFGGKQRDLDETQRHLNEIRRDQKECQAALNAAKRTSRNMGLRGVVLYPGVLLVSAAFLSKIAQNASAPIGRPALAGTLVLVFLPFLLGLALLVRALVGFRSISQRSLPDLDVSVDPWSSPWNAGQRARVRIRASLHRGEVLPAAQILLLVPPSCELLTTTPIWAFADDHPPMPGYRVITSRVRDIRTWAPLEWIVDDLQPRCPGPLKLYWAIDGQGYSTEPQPISVDVG